jgi:uncharacterized membrane protein
MAYSTRGVLSTQQQRVPLAANQYYLKGASFASSVRHPNQSQLAAGMIPFLTFPLVKANDTWGNVAVLASCASLAEVFGTKTKGGRLLGPPVSGMFIAFVLGSIGILAPGGTQCSKVLQGIALTLATPLILMGADLRDCRRKAGALLGSFAIASVATWVASCTGFLLCRSMMQQALPINQDGLKIADALCAKNIGGGINYIAVCQCLQASPQAIAAGLCVDNIAALIYFPVTSALASGRPDVEDTSIQETADRDSSATEVAKNIAVDEAERKGTQQESAPFSVANVSSALALAAMCAWGGERIGGVTGLGSLPCSTIITLAVALLGPKAFIDTTRPSAEMLGTVLLYLFFVTAGAPGMRIASSVQSSFLPLSAFLMCLYGIHGAILLLYHKVLTAGSTSKETTGSADQGSASPQRLLVASSAAIGGPATSIALAKASNWPSLVVPSILVGNIGYALATFIGIAFYSIFKVP